MIDGFLSKVFGGDDLLDDLLEDLLSQFFGANGLSVLSTDDDGVDSQRDHSSIIVLILNGDLSLGCTRISISHTTDRKGGGRTVRSEPWQRAVSSGSGHGSVELVGQLESKREQLWGLIGSIAKHDTLVTSTKLL